ncbi:tRNA1(Val) (adenine(37)-N6)-methyltransferase [Thaumasiovibrio sp. DFM-14]|uniref:tRNA1(Val) (adenine(37)-N6)-methyltransferase n=1 Tax=Thaumasiovibrio sp. DFM-14 TaxID=3384792 RepID=UPI0039A224D3
MSAFRLKQFTIEDAQCGMPVSTDGILLGAWSQLPKQGKIADIGTGSGLLALMAAQRSTHSEITAIEIEANAAAAAHNNFLRSPWADRLTLIHTDVRDWLSPKNRHSIDAIICNPPYFTSGETSQCNARALARHTQHFDHHALLTVIQQLLNVAGYASLILPEQEGRQLINAAQALGLHCSRLCEVNTTARKPISRLLIELTPTPQHCDQQQLTIHANNGYSEAFIALTWPFYLKMSSPKRQNNQEQ